MIGQKLSHYRVVEKIGEGGMGQVFKARDEHLDRDVAIKVLREDLTSDSERLRRFEQEARSASALNHPNIVHIYDINKRGDTPFIAMEYVDGQTLRDVLANGPLPTKKLLELSTQIAEGLAKAHAAGIIHRDLKPENLMVTSDGYVKIVDFGLAKLLPGHELDSEAATMTQEGTIAGAIMGTASYMSPEQALGKPLDARTDVFSFGSVLYEMATGERAFQGETSAGLFNEILNKAPASPSSLNPELPKDLDEIIYKALDKNAAGRYSTAAGMLQALRTIPEGPKTERISSERSIAVLPFVNMSADPEQEYFCDGMAEEIINALTRVENLRVIARTSAFAFKGKHEDVREIGRKLGVDTLLEGSVRRAGNRLRITAQLIHVEDGSHLWSERYDREIEDVFAIQDEISLNIVEKLEVELLGVETASISERTTVKPEVYNLYLLGSYHWNRCTVEDIKKSQQYYEGAIALDPNYAPAHGGLALVHLRATVDLGLLPPVVAIPRVKQAAARALELDPGNANAHRGLAIIAVFWEHNWDRAEYHSKRAIEAHPNIADGRQPYAFLLSAACRHEEAIREITRAVELDPVSALMTENAAFHHYLARDFDTAIEYCERSITLDPDFDAAPWVLGMIYIQKHRFNEAISMLEKVKTVKAYSEGYLGYAYASDGKADRARQILRDLKEQHVRGEASAYGLALVHLGLDDKDDALDYLEKSCDERPFYLLTAWLKPDPIWDPLRSSSRFQDLLRRMNFPE